MHNLRDRPTAPYRNGISRFYLCILCSHVAGRKNVRKEKHLLIRQIGFDLDRPNVSVRHPEVLRLSAGIPAEQMRKSKEPCWRVPHQFSAPPRHWGLVVSHAEKSVFEQKKHEPHAMTNGTTTRSPFSQLRYRACRPRRTIPIGSCPRMSPSSMVGWYPS
jgi:hypothetical protein